MGEVFEDIIKMEDWKTEKHVPYIEFVGELKRGAPITVKITVGKEIPHPNTTEHHIRWIKLLFIPSGSAFAIDLGRVEFNSHGESTAGPNKSGVYTEPTAYFVFRTDSSGKLVAVSYCNIHGLWAYETELKLE